ncbi:molecular chaperone [Pantoea sp. 1.19]|uniref:molecular chaperone n=1 Tax=Pantoea sp. 1.19 TaxID=1925589 RepID=UPI000948E267|nr:molecular chaperone [Pantoea sp. 1.19]
MFIGFDYGTANCSVAVMRNSVAELLPLHNGSPWLPSMISGTSREAISEWLFRHHRVPTPHEENRAMLQRALRANREEDLEIGPEAVQFGLDALASYMTDPDETWFVKSPKSFLGASGLKPQQLALFEDLVCAMMLNIRQRAEAALNHAISGAVIGRPVNFQGLGGDEANAQAQGILARAAARAGFRQVAFQFEPVAAGLDFEATLSEETRVLVVDIGGGTTDCSLLLMGPAWQQQVDRSASLLGHSGCRVGGNDLDIMLAFKTLMPQLGLGTTTQRGIALPALPWWNAVAINDVPAQSDFYAAATRKQLQEMVRDAADPDAVARLLKVWQQRLGYRLVRAAEESKIALSATASSLTSLAFIADGLETTLQQSALPEAIAQPLERILEQVSLAMALSETRPDVIYLTGGSARSPLIRAALQQRWPEIPLASGDDFGSVTAGLARWAQLTLG